MDAKLLGYIISAVIMILWGISFYFFKRNDKRKDDSIAILFETSKKQGLEIKALEGDINVLKSENATLEKKLWKESKLEKLIKAAIKSEFMEWELRLMKEGALKPGS